MENSEDLRELFKIYHIESPNTSDLIAGRNESDGITSCLKLAEVKFKTFSPTSTQELYSVIEEIILDVLPLRADLGSIILHFSMHGDSTGIKLTNEDLITWNEMVNLLNKLIEGIGRIPASRDILKQDVAPIYLVFSSCYGSHASKINSLTSEQLFIGLIGPKKEIAWADAQTAYVLFYHNTILKQKGYLETVELMNRVVNDDIFSLYPGHGFGAF